jgi:hypothetical protein
VLVCLGACAGGVLLLGVTAAGTHLLATALAVVGFCLFCLGVGAASPNENDLLHRRVPSAQRATALSVQSLAQQLVGALTGLIVGALRPGPLPWLLTGAVLLSGVLLWLRRADARSTPVTTTT